MDRNDEFTRTRGLRFRRLNIKGPVVCLTFDICSSVQLLEELILRDDVQAYWWMIGQLKRLLIELQKTVEFDPYKYTGDGWILLFPINDTLDGAKLWRLAVRVAEQYRDLLHQHLLAHLNIEPTVRGLTVGIDSGPVWPAIVLQQREYFGSPLAIASRLQSKIKELCRPHANYALISQSTYRTFFSSMPELDPVDHYVPLSNVQGEKQFHCKLVKLIDDSPSESPIALL